MFAIIGGISSVVECPGQDIFVATSPHVDRSSLEHLSSFREKPHALLQEPLM